MICNTKVPIELENTANFIYRTTYPSCFSKYIEKLDRNLW